MKDQDLCWECRKKMKDKQVEYSLYGQKIGKFPAKVCEKCNETIFSEETSKKITQIVKQKGLWGLQVKTKVGQSGSTLDIRLPKKIIEFFNLKKGEEVTIYPEDKDKMIITI
ncbi:MAG: hypothetical protein ABII01_03080 [Candidatus Woesearchaeota archaeon]